MDRAKKMRRGLLVDLSFLREGWFLAGFWYVIEYSKGGVLPMRLGSPAFFWWLWQFRKTGSMNGFQKVIKLKEIRDQT